jgi:cytochrome c oxidase subunit II
VNLKQIALALLLASASLTGSPLHAQDQTIEIHAHRFSFSPAEITLERGKTVKLSLVSEDVTHSLVVPELNINQEIKKDKPVEVTITPTTGGDFHGQCGHFCGSGHGGMTFVIHVKD